MESRTHQVITVYHLVLGTPERPYGSLVRQQPGNPGTDGVVLQVRLRDASGRVTVIRGFGNVITWKRVEVGEVGDLGWDRDESSHVIYST